MPAPRAAASGRWTRVLSVGRVAPAMLRIRVEVPEGAGTARRACGLAILLVCGALGAHAARAANPQSYKVDWVSCGDKSIDSTLKLTSQLATLQKTAPSDPFGLIARARGDENSYRNFMERHRAKAAAAGFEALMTNADANARR